MGVTKDSDPPAPISRCFRCSEASGSLCACFHPQVVYLTQAPPPPPQTSPKSTQSGGAYLTASHVNKQSPAPCPDPRTEPSSAGQTPAGLRSLLSVAVRVRGHRKQVISSLGYPARSAIWSSAITNTMSVTSAERLVLNRNNVFVALLRNRK